MVGTRPRLPLAKRRSVDGVALGATVMTKRQRSLDVTTRFLTDWRLVGIVQLLVSKAHEARRSVVSLAAFLSFAPGCGSDSTTTTDPNAGPNGSAPPPPTQP